MLVDEVLPHCPISQWNLSLPFALRYLFATQAAIMGNVSGIVLRALSGHQFRKAGFSHRAAATGAVMLVQRFGSARNLHVHLHMLLLDGAYAIDKYERRCFHEVKAPDRVELQFLFEQLSIGESRTYLLVCNVRSTPEPGCQPGPVAAAGADSQWPLLLGQTWRVRVWSSQRVSKEVRK